MYRKLSEEKKEFRYWFDLYYDSVYSYVSFKISCTEDIEDTVQDIFYHLWKHRDALYASDAPESIVLKSTHQKIADFYRTVSHIPVALQNDIPFIPYDSELVQDPDEQLSKIENLLEVIPERRQKIFRMNKLENKTQQEIADEFNMSKSAVENQIRKTMLYLKANLNNALVAAWFMLN